jgi:NitT/TauT family transport system permease protein
MLNSGNRIGFLVSALVVTSYCVLFWLIIIRPRITDALTLLRPTKKSRSGPGTYLLYWSSPLLFAALWGIASYTGLAAGTAIPTPSGVFLSFCRLFRSGTLPAEALISFSRILVGFFLASLVGVPLGLFTGTFIVGRLIFAPVNSFLRYIPPTAFIVLLIVYFGVDESFKYAVVFSGVVFFITQMTIDAVDDVDTRYIEIALASGTSNWGVFRSVVLPSSWPRIFDILRINLSAAWTFLVAAELIGAERGLGHFIAISQRFLRLEDVYAGILTFGIIGILTDAGLERLSHKLFRWYYVALKR